MDKPPDSGTKEKRNKLIGKLFRRKSKKSEGAEKSEDGKVCEYSCLHCLVLVVFLMRLSLVHLWWEYSGMGLIQVQHEETLCTRPAVNNCITLKGKPSFRMLTVKACLCKGLISLMFR